jgi:hypothetical protein
MKNQKTLTIIGAAILIYFLFPKKKTTSAGGGESTNNSLPNSQLMRKAQFKNTVLNAGRRQAADITGVIY